MGVKIFECVVWILLCLLALKGFCGFWLHVHEFACPCVSLVSFKSSEVQILVKPLPIFLQNAWWEHNNTDSRLKLCMSASLFCSSFSEYPAMLAEANIDKWGPVWAVDDSDAFPNTLDVMHLSTSNILSNGLIVLLTQSQTNSSVIIPSLWLL